MLSHSSQLETHQCSQRSTLLSKLRAEERLAPILDLLGPLSEVIGAPVVLAGGAVRDALLERPIKDYDLFVSHKAYWSGLITELVRSGIIPKGEFNLITTYDECDTPFGREVGMILTWMLEGIEVQLIFLKGFEVTATPEDFTNRMDFGMSRVAYCQGKFHIDQSFYRDVQNRTFTYLRGNPRLDDLTRSFKRFERLHDKYPGYIMLLPHDVKDKQGLFSNAN